MTPNVENTKTYISSDNEAAVYQELRPHLFIFIGIYLGLFRLLYNFITII